MEQQKEKEGELILKALLPGDVVVLLDEHGKEDVYKRQPLKRITYLSNGLVLKIPAIQNGNRTCQVSLTYCTITHPHK